MKTICALVMITVLCSFSGCERDTNFFEDSTNPGLSRFTNRGYNVVSFYLNDQPWTGPYNSRVGRYSSQVILKETTAAVDTVYISWAGTLPDSLTGVPSDIFTMGIPVKKNFTLADFYAFHERRLPDPGTQVSFFLNNGEDFSMAGLPDAEVIKGTGTVTFASIEPNPADDSSFVMAGVFQASMANGVRIEKGRFDYRYYRGEHNLR